jgi:DNA-damage-inducible protein D
MENTLFDVTNVEHDKFELSCHKNGTTRWLATELAAMLSYTDYKTFLKSINKAMAVCASSNMQISEHFTQLENNEYKLSRFACFLVTMNADIKKESVAKAQVYFAALADSMNELMQSEQIERVEIREEITTKNKTLNATANLYGVQDYGRFTNAGYMGMYNMSINELKRIKGISGTNKTIFDFMGKRELAANLFRISETEAKIKSSHIYGQKGLENTAHEVGRKVRTIMIDNDGIAPEKLAFQKDINEVKKGIKDVAKNYKKLENKKR